MAVALVERELVYGLLAMQVSPVGRDGLIAALTDWSREASWPSGAPLGDRLGLNDAQRRALDGLTRAYLADHQADLASGLAALDRQGVLRELAARPTDGPLRAWLT